MKIKLEGIICGVERNELSQLDTITIEVNDCQWTNVAFLWSECRKEYVPVRIEKDGSFITPQ